MLFSDYWLKPWLLKSLSSMGYQKPTEIQAKVLNIALSWKNIVGQSQTWTWKTTAFLLPILNKINPNHKNIQALIIAPTRELVNQIWDEIRDLTKFHEIRSVCLYWWSSPVVQKKKLRKKPSIIVATPGRLMDFMSQRVVDVRTVDFFVLDEVDIMLDMGFVRDIKKIRSQLKNLKQTYTFSATMNDKMKSIIKEYISKYESIKIWEKVTVDKIDQKHLSIEHEHKIHNLIHLIKTYPKDKTLVFTHTKRNTKTLHTILTTANLNAGLLNWNLSQSKRQSTLNAFKDWKTRILVTTDVAARGLNMDNVGLVINFDVPIDAKSYIHRIWRTWRAGAKWKAIMFVSKLEKPLLRDIERLHKTRVYPTDHIPVYDEHWTYKHFKLDRSTDKKWWWRNRSSKNNFWKNNSKTNSNSNKTNPHKTKSKNNKNQGFRKQAKWSINPNKRNYNAKKAKNMNR